LLGGHYSKKVAVSTDNHNVEFLAAYGKQETLEGPPTEGTVILKFESIEAAKDWYHSEEYQSTALLAVNIMQQFLVNGIDTK
jgi:uncharacterized protein (DUF1330 family)